MKQRPRYLKAVRSKFVKSSKVDSWFFFLTLQASIVFLFCKHTVLQSAKAFIYYRYRLAIGKSVKLQMLEFIFPALPPPDTCSSVP